MWLETLFLVLCSSIPNKRIFCDECYLTDLSVINLQMMRHCHYKQSFVLSHANHLYNYYNTSTQEDNNQTEIQGLYQYSSAFNCHEFADSNKHA